MKGTPMERKRLSISAKRQITIPQKFYTMLGFDAEAECLVRNGELIIRPIKESSGGDFAEQILADLLAKGYSGSALLDEFKKAQRKVRPAVEELLISAENIASGKGEYYSYDEVFDDKADE